MFIESIESHGCDLIWDFGVEGNHNYESHHCISHNCWFDEEIYESEWYKECSARLLDRAGRFIWSATPQSATEQLYELHEQSIEEQGKPKPRIEEFHFLLDDNPFIDPEQIAIFKAKAAMDYENYKVRVEGKFLVASHRVYPEFNEMEHCCESFRIPDGSQDDEVGWCRYLVVDPGYRKPGALFLAVPPDGKHVYVYDEFFPTQCSAKDFAEQIYHKVQGQAFEAFLIDNHGSRRTEQNGKTIGQQYGEEFAKKDIRSAQTGSYFVLIGSSSEQFGHGFLKAQISQVRSWLWEGPDGKPKLQIFQDRCPTTIDQMKKYKNKTDKGKPLDEVDARKWSEGPDMVRYAVLHGLPWVKPRKPKPRVPELVKYLDRKAKTKRQDDGNYVLLGPRPQER